jgi:hypothetical protein
MRAKGLFFYLMTLPNGWKIRVSELVSHFKDGRDAVYGAFRELKEAGYVKEYKRLKDGKFDGMDYSIIESLQLPHAGKPLAGKPYTVNQQLLSTEKVNTDKVKESKDSRSDPAGSPFGLDPLPGKIYPRMNQLKDLLTRGRFQTRTDRTSKVLDRTFKYIDSIMEWDPDWEDKNNIDLSPIRKLKGKPYKEIYKSLSRAFSRFGRMKSDEKVWPEDKKNLKGCSLDVFFYNPRTQKSWLLYCMSNAPSSVGSVPSVDKARLTTSYSGIESIWGKVYNTTDTKNWNSSQWGQFYSCVLSLERWWKNNRSMMELVNSGWISIGRTFPAFLRTVMDYIQECWSGDLRPFFLPMSGNRWNGFISWVQNHYGVDLDPSDEKVEKAQKRKSRAGEIQKEKLIQERMDLIQQTLTANGQDPMEYEDLRNFAIEELDKKGAAV